MVRGRRALGIRFTGRVGFTFLDKDFDAPRGGNCPSRLISRSFRPRPNVAALLPRENRMATEVVRWVLRDGNRQLTCVTRALGEGSELAVVYYDGLPLRSKVCVDDADGFQWTNDVRNDWMAHGWIPATP